MKDKEDLAKRLAESAEKWESEKKKIAEKSQNELNQIRANLENTQVAENKDKERRIAELEADLKATEDELRTLEVEFAEYRDHDKQSKEYIEALEIELATLRNDTMTSVDRLGLTNLQLSEAKGVIASHVEQERKDQEAIEFLTSSCNELEEKLAHSLGEFENDLTLLKEAHADEVNELVAELADLRLIIQKKDSQLLLNEIENEKSTLLIEDLNSQLTDSENRLKDLQAQLQQVAIVPEEPLEQEPTPANESLELLVKNLESQLLEKESQLGALHESTDLMLLERDSQIKTLEDAIQNLLESVSHKEHPIDDHSSNAPDATNEELQCALQLLRSKDSDIEHLKLDLLSKEEEIAKLRHLPLMSPPEPVAIQQQVHSPDLTPQLKDKDNQIQKLKDTIESLKITMAARAIPKESIGDHESMLSLLADKDAFIKMLEQRLDEKESQMQELPNGADSPSSSLDAERDAKIATLEASNRELQKHVQLLRKDRRHSKPESIEQSAPVKQSAVDPLSKLLDDLQSSQNERILLQAALKKKDDDLQSAVTEYESLNEEKHALDVRHTTLSEKCQHLEVAAADAKAREKAAMKQIDSLRLEIDDKLAENEKLKRIISELEASQKEFQFDSPSPLSKTPVTQSPSSPEEEELTPLSTATEVRPREQQPTLHTRPLGRNVTPSALAEVMNELAGEESESDCSGVTEMKPNRPNPLEDKLTEMTTRCRIAEFDAVESLKKVASLTRENGLLSTELEEVNQELSLARKRIESLQQRLVNISSQSPPPPPLRGNGIAAAAPGSAKYNLDRIDRGGSDYGGSDCGSTQGMPPNSGRQRGGPRGGAPFDEYGDDGHTNGWGTSPDTMHRRVTAAFSNRLSSFDSGARGGGGSVHDDLSVSHISPNGGTGPLYREKDTVICKRMSDWLIKVANIVPSRAAAYAVTLVQNGQASLRRLEKSLKKEPDFLLHLGFDDDDAEEIADAINAEAPGAAPSRPSLLSDPRGGNHRPQSSPQKPMGGHQSGGLPPRDRRSLSPPNHSTSFMSSRNQHQNMSSDASIRSFSSVHADYLTDPEAMNPDKAFREARLARLESQAQQAAELAQLASEDADRVAQTYRHGKPILRASSSGMSSSGSSPKRTSSSTSSKKFVAQAHEKGEALGQFPSTYSLT
jgi:hypothetical protein